LYHQDSFSRAAAPLQQFQAVYSWSFLHTVCAGLLCCCCLCFCQCFIVVPWQDIAEHKTIAFYGFADLGIDWLCKDGAINYKRVKLPILHAAATAAVEAAAAASGQQKST
jgi:hypothetical protein